MADNSKARVELLNETTGEPIREVDIITNSKTVQYTNPAKMQNQVGSFEKGTSFNKKPVSEVLDGILYTYAKPTINYLISSNGDITSDIQDEHHIYKEAGVYVNEFDLSVNITIGSTGVVIPTLIINKSDSTTKTITGSEITDEPGTIKTIKFTVPQVTMTSSLEVSLSDGQNQIDFPHIIYDFVDPAYVGFTVIDALDENNELSDTEKLVAHLNVSINNGSPTLKKYIGPKTDIWQIIRTDVNYDTRSIMRPVIAVPKSWDNIIAIKDLNGNNITKCYEMSTSIMLTTNKNRSLEYIVMVHKDTFYDNEKILTGIKYDFLETNGKTNLLDYQGRFTPLLNGFDVKYAHPLDSRTVVDTYADLMRIQFPYTGLLTYVKEIKTFFKYEDNNWVVTCNRLHIVELTADLTDDLGGWDDVAIVSGSGAVYRKRYNNVWELWGTI